MAKPTSESRRSRPVCHIWALVAYLFVTGTIMFLIFVDLIDVSGVIVGVFGTLALVLSIFAPMSKAAYKIGMCALLVIILRMLQSLYSHIFPASGTPSHWIVIVGTTIFMFLMALVFYDYAMGDESRRYFGLPSLKESKV